MAVLIFLALVAIVWVLTQIRDSNQQSSESVRQQLVQERLDDLTLTLDIDWKDFAKYAYQVLLAVHSSNGDEDLVQRLFNIYSSKTGESHLTLKSILNKTMTLENMKSGDAIDLFIFVSYQVYDRRLSIKTKGDVLKFKEMTYAINRIATQDAAGFKDVSQTSNIDGEENEKTGTYF